jgi:hypothetical protein
MTRGLVRSNNLSDLPSPEQARINLGLNNDDYDAIKSLYVGVGLRATDVQRIARSSNNYQLQIDTASGTLAGIVVGDYVATAGDVITGTWTNTGLIQSATIIQGGTTLTASSDALFTLTGSGLSYSLSTASLTMASGLTVQALRDNGSVVFASGVVTNKLVPIKIGDIQFFVEAG